MIVMKISSMAGFYSIIIIIIVAVIMIVSVGNKLR